MWQPNRAPALGLHPVPSRFEHVATPVRAGFGGTQKCGLKSEKSGLSSPHLASGRVQDVDLGEQARPELELDVRLHEDGRKN